MPRSKVDTKKKILNDFYQSLGVDRDLSSEENKVAVNEFFVKQKEKFIEFINEKDLFRNEQVREAIDGWIQNQLDKNAEKLNSFLEDPKWQFIQDNFNLVYGLAGKMKLKELMKDV